MYVYHYCATYSTESGQGYNSGVVESENKIHSREYYTALADDIAAKLNMNTDEFVILSLTLVS